jgi:chemotaxis protein CheX
VDVSYVNPFIRSVVDTFKTMFNQEVTPGKPELKKHPYPTYDVSGIIGLSGDAQGAISLSFPKAVALRVVSEMLGSQVKIIGPEVTDGVGELTNIITGYAKKDLSQYRLSISLPSVVIGREHTLATPKGTPTMLVPLKCPLGEFVMEVSLKTR